MTWLCPFSNGFHLIPLVLPKELIQDTSDKLKPLGLLCAALGVDDKLGQRPIHLTAWSRVELRDSFPKQV